MKYLYKNFLKDRREYDLNVAYWQRYMNRALKELELIGEKYLTDRFTNGELFRDGNPIYNAKVKSLKKAFRIIQELPEEFENYYTSFFKEIEIDETEYLEFVVVLTLTTQNRDRAVHEIVEWLSESSA
jgi:hypothetical protein